MPPLPIHLRPILPADLPTLYQIQLDPEGNALAAVIPRDLPTFSAIWHKILTDPETKANTIPRAIIVDDASAGPTLVGSINIFKRDGLDFIGYWIAREHWGKGIATRALALMLQEVNTRPLHARVATHNAASLRILQRRGFIITEKRHSPATDRFQECEEAMLILK